MDALRFGIEIGNFSWPGGPAEIANRLRRIATAAEVAGLDSLWLWDHFAQWSRRWNEPFLESWTTLGYLAAVTDRIALGIMVSGVTHRYPAVLVKQASTLDVLSGGRSYFGVGAGWNEREHRAFGIPFPPLSERFRLLEDTVRIAQRAWSGERGKFRGHLVELSEHVDSPSPLRRPHPPILIGGGGELKTLRLVAEYADACNFGQSPDDLRRKIGVLDDHCTSVGRDPESIERTTTVMLPDLRERRKRRAGIVAKYLGEMVAAGAQHLILGVPDGSYEHAINWLADDVIPRVGPTRAERRG